MKIGVTSDTHSRDLPPQMLKDFETVDFIVHAGDFCSGSDLKKLQAIKEVQGVYGNMDGPDIHTIFPRKQVLKLGLFKIGLFHGEGPPQMILDRVKAEFAKEKVDCIVFGHSHRPFNERISGVLYFNPGSPNDTVFAPYCSYGILEISKEGIKGKVVKVVAADRTPS